MGVDFDGKLSLKSHVNRTSLQNNFRLFGLRQLRDVLPEKHLLMYQNSVGSILKCAAALMIGMNRSLEIDIERTQNRAHVITSSYLHTCMNAS